MTRFLIRAGAESYHGLLAYTLIFESVSGVVLTSWWTIFPSKLIFKINLFEVSLAWSCGEIL